MSAVHAYRYAGSSTLTSSGLHLVTDTATSGPATFFQGRLRHPRLSADLLTAVALVVGSRFYLPPNATARQFTDPIVTAGAGMLRFEGFSACASTWARLDIDRDGYDVGSGTIGHGTTNVDFNPPLRAALARVRDGDVLDLVVGGASLTLQHGDAPIVEKKVPLPARWLRSLVEVQSYLAAMEQRTTVSGAVALRFLRSLPRTTTRRTPLWVVDGPGGLRLTTTVEQRGVRFADVQRLRVLESLAMRATSMSLFADERGLCSAWLLRFPGATLTLALTSEVWRGFSGEGTALRALARTDTADVIARVRGALSWEHTVDVDVLAAALHVERDLVEDALRVLGTSGLVGYDLVAQRYFHRVLPFSMDSIADFNPRLVDARALQAAGAVVVDADGSGAIVHSGDVDYRVRVDDDERCTCPWFAKHQGDRGPCKHLLAFELARDARST